jgi:hypothetical protein
MREIVLTLEDEYGFLDESFEEFRVHILMFLVERDLSSYQIIIFLRFKSNVFQKSKISEKKCRKIRLPE